MATSPPEPSPSTATTSSTDPSKIEIWKDAIYEQCQVTGDERRLFSPQDIFEFGIIPNADMPTLLRILQSLSDDKRLICVMGRDGLLWKWRPAAEAEKYKLCQTDEQRMVYEEIDGAGGDGIWSKTMQYRLKMHDSILKTALKQLVAKNLIAPFKNVEHPSKKMYIKASIRPSERATGGPWFTDQMFDEAFIDELQRVIFDFIKKHGSYHSKHNVPSGRTAVPKKGVLKGVADRDKGKKRSADLISEEGTNGKSGQPVLSSASKKDVFLPMPAGYTDYPTVRDIARLISKAGVTTNTILGEEDIQKLVDVLVFDGLVEPVKVAGRLGYRVCRVSKQSADAWAGRQDEVQEHGAPEPYVNGYTEAPCGRCPLFDICEEGGPVSASNCVYFQQWLGLE